MTLYDQDRTALLQGEWLSDAVISAGIELLHEQFPNVRGLQPTSLAEEHKFDIQRGEFVQCLNVYGSHWITIAGCGYPGTINIYDSLPSCTLDSRTKRQIASIMYTDCSTINVNFIDVQIQVGIDDCGLFALAFAASLCAGENPSELTYPQHKLRSHLTNCIENHRLDPFPQGNRRTRAKIRGTTSFNVFCTCRRPEYGRMIACNDCKQWFHEECVRVPSKLWKNKKMDWFCNMCVQLAI